MATRTYTPSLAPFASGIDTVQLGSLIDTALSRSGTVVTYLRTNTLAISVTHAFLVPADDAAINAVFAAYVFDPNFQTAEQTASNRAAGLALIGGLEGSGKVLRAEASLLVDELNALRQWLVQFKIEVAAATSLADLKTRVGTLPAMPDRTLSQAVTAIQNKINAGTVDSAP